MEVEIWKDIPGFEGRYQISSLCRVKSLMYHNGMSGWVKRDKIISQRISKAGKYYVVTLRLNYKVFVKKVHNVFASAFIPNPENKKFVNHKDGNKLNNNIGNLEWCTSSENNQHAWDTGLKIRKYGEDNACSKLTDCQVKEISEMLDSGISVKSISESYRVTTGAIYPIKNKTHGYFIKTAQCS